MKHTKNIATGKSKPAKFGQLIQSSPVCTLIYCNQEEGIITRPLYTANIDKDGNLYIFFSESQKEMENIARNNIVNLLYHGNSRQWRMEVAGNPILIMDKTKMRNYWNQLLDAYYPQGMSKMKLLKVYVTEISMWDDFHTEKQLLYSLVEENTLEGKEDNALLQKVG